MSTLFHMIDEKSQKYTNLTIFYWRKPKEAFFFLLEIELQMNMMKCTILKIYIFSDTEYLQL